MTIEQVKENILNLEEVHNDEFYNTIMEAFEDYDYKGENSILMTGEGHLPLQFQVYANHIEAPIIIINVEYDDMYINIRDVSICY